MKCISAGAGIKDAAAGGSGQEKFTKRRESLKKIQKGLPWRN